MRGFLSLLLSIVSLQASAQSLQSICNDVSPDMGQCEVHFSEQNKNWGELYSGLLGSPTFDKDYAVVVGIETYGASAYPPLSGRQQDAERMRDFLIEEGFDFVVMLTNEAASKDRIELLMLEIIPPLLGPNDRFFFHFSGHGETQKLAQGHRSRGYLVTSAARGRSNYTNMISMNDVLEWSLNIEVARQSLWLIDACFSGLASPQPMGNVETELANKTIETTRRRLAQRGHHMLTAGLDEEQSLIIDGRSVFTNAFINAVRQGDKPSGNLPADGLISLAEIEVFVQKAVDIEVTRANGRVFGRTPYKMSPRRAVLHDDYGQFFFVDPLTINSSTKEVILPAPKQIEVGGGISEQQSEIDLFWNPYDRGLVLIGQRRLWDLGYLDGSVDGLYGRVTEGAIINFQKTNGLKLTGVLDTTTFRSLTAENATTAPVELKTVLPTAGTGPNFYSSSPEIGGRFLRNGCIYEADGTLVVGYDISKGC